MTEVASALRQGADWIEDHGWFRLNDNHLRGDRPACAVTSLMYATSSESGWGVIRNEAVHKLAEAIEGRKLKANAMAGFIVGDWNDAQDSADVVIAKMREVADKLEGKG